jgi:hypothetical protein
MIELLPGRGVADYVICKGRSVEIVYPAGQDSGDLVAFAKMCETGFPNCIVTIRSGKRVLAIWRAPNTLMVAPNLP